MKLFKETQIGWVIIGIFIGVIAIVLASYQPEQSNSIASLYLPLGIIIVSLLCFCTMTTTVYEDKIVIRYGIGIFKCIFALNALEQGHEKTIPWWWGAGIRFYNKGTLYSINFTKAVEFKLKQRNEHYISIGSKKPEQLIQVVNSAIEKNNI